MLIDRFDRISEYYNKIPNLEQAVQFIQKEKPKTPGRYEFSGGYLLYQELETKPEKEGIYENHRRYLDLQVLIEGEGWGTLWMEEVLPYDSIKDTARWIGEGAYIQIMPGMFVCFYPEDAHKPDRFGMSGHSEHVKKYVLKLELNEKRSLRK